MAIHGVVTRHMTPYDGNRHNRWWVDAGDLEEACNHGNAIVDIIRDGFGQGNTFNNVHAWVPNSTPNQFLNLPIAKPGMYTSTTPTSAVPVIKMEFVAGVNSYVNYKVFRIGVDPDEQVGRTWGTTVTNTWATIMTNLASLDFLRGRTGNNLDNFALSNFVHYRQLSKKWYNRGSSDGD